MYIKVRVIAGAKKEKFDEISTDHFILWVRQKAERNLANKRVIEIISDHFKTKKVRIINGHHSPIKLLSVGD